MYKRILIPTDGSACSELAVQQGLTLAKALGADVTFLYALEDPTTVFYTPEGATHTAGLYDSFKEGAEEVLAQAAAAAAVHGVKASTLLAERQHPAQAIHEAEENADLVVMGTHGRRGFNRLVFGSVAEEALRLSERPYLMVRKTGHVEKEAA